MRIIDKVKRNLDRCASLRDERPIVLAVSGGLDSMCLLDLIFKALNGKRRLVVAHFNHGLRGEESDTDEAYVQTVAEKLKLDFRADRTDVAAISAERGVSVEMAARDARHAFFARMATDVGASAVILAHHANDQIETFFLRVLRGGSAGALGGMALEGPSPANSSVSMVRPLLSLSRAELEAYANENGIEFREDESNTDTEILRNRVRHLLVPFLGKEFGAGFLKTVPRIAESLRDDDAYIRAEADRWMREPQVSFDALPTALTRSVLAARLRSMGIEPEFDLMERLLRSERGLSVSGPDGVSLRLSSAGIVEKVDLQAEHDSEPFCREVLIDENGTTQVGRFEFSVLPYLSSEEPRLFNRAAGEDLVDADKIGLRLELRSWLPGDRMQPLGMRGAKKLQDIFVDEKVPAAERRKRLVLVAPDDRICWLEGFRIADWARIGSETRRVLRVRTMDLDGSD